MLEPARLLEATPECVILAGRDGRIAFANRRAEEVSGYSRDELVGAPIDRLLPRGPVSHRAIGAATNGGSIATECVRRDGEPLPVEVRVGIVEADGEQFQLLALRDVTELRAGMDARFEAEAKYQALVERIPAITYIDEIDENGRSIYVSPQVTYTQAGRDRADKLSLTTRLRRAVDNQSWTLHYQPVVRLEDQSIVSVEALLRWQDPNGGIVPPGEFIPLAEEMGLIGAIGDWVIEELASQHQRWRQGGLQLDVSFNLSPRQLWQASLGEKIIDQLRAHDVDTADVVVEITESTAMTDPERTRKLLSELHAWGLRLAIDDFGTGYSSLSRLRHLPVHLLKIDRTFVRDVDADADAASMVRAMIQLALSLGMTPVAEGIETPGELAFLVDDGCPLGQGSLLSRPVAADHITALMSAGGGRIAPDRVGS